MELYASFVSGLLRQSEVVRHEGMSHHHVVHHGVTQKDEDGEHEEHERTSTRLVEAIFGYNAVDRNPKAGCA